MGRSAVATTVAALLGPAAAAAERVSFVFPSDKPLHLRPSSASSSGLIDDSPLLETHPTFTVPSSYEVFYHSDAKTRQIQSDLGLDETGLYDEVVAPNYYQDGSCDPPPSSAGYGDAEWPGDGCVCFEPEVLQTSFYEMSTEAQDVETNAFGYRTAFDTSVTGGLTLEGWFRASDTSGEPILAASNHPGIQYSHILTRGEKASWAAGFNFGMGKGSGFRLEVVLNNDSTPNRITAQSPNYSWFPGINVWHHVVATYDADAGRIAIYVDGLLQGEDYVDSSLSRAERDVRWGTNEVQAGKTRIGNGYDANDKNFFGCTGGLALYGGVATALPLVEASPASDAAADCIVFSDVSGLYDALVSSTDGMINVCAGSTPISWDETQSLDTSGKIYINDNERDLRSYSLNCVVASGSSGERCVIDFNPADPASLSPSNGYGGFVLQDAHELYVDGFEFANRRGKGPMFYVQHGSRLTITNSVFRDNGQVVPEGEDPIIMDTYSTSGWVTTIITDSVFANNTGVLLDNRSGNFVLRDSVFYDNGLPVGYEDTYTHVSFISWNYIPGAVLTLSGNQFVGFRASASSGAQDTFWMVSSSSPSSTPSTLNDLFAGVADDNCARDNDVAGEELRAVSPNGAFGTCNDGIYGKATWPYIECRSFAEEPCAEFGEEGPPLPSAGFGGTGGPTSSSEPIDSCGLTESNRTAQITAIALGASDASDYSSVVSDPSSPQGRALNFTLSDPVASELCPNVSDDNYQGGMNAIHQMYILLTLYFSTAGDAWTDKSGWLNSSDVCAWAGVSCTVWNQDRVTQLALYENNLVGTIPPELGRLDTLELLNLGNGVGATANNEFGDGIPTEIFALTNLRYLKLTNTQLGGTIPTDIGWLSSATQIYLDWNSLTGTVPTQVGTLSNLGKLWLSGNDIVGPLPTQLGNLSALRELTCQNCENLDGPIPTQLGSLTSMTRLVLRNTGLSGNIPHELGNLVALTHLQLQDSDSLTGIVPVCDGSAVGGTFPNLATVTADCRAVSCTCCTGGNSCPSLLTLSPSTSPTTSPTSSPSYTLDFMHAGNGVSFPSANEVVLQSSSSAIDQFGAVITTHAFNGSDVDFSVTYNQTSFFGVQTGYESQIFVFFAEEGAYPESLLQTDNDFDEFLSRTVGFLQSKVFANGSHTWFYCGTNETRQGSSTDTMYYDLSLRLRRLNNQIYAYWKEPGGTAWTNVRDPMEIPVSLHDVPIQFGFRVKKEWKSHHNFLVQTTKTNGGPPLPIPARISSATSSPSTTSPTELPSKSPTSSPSMSPVTDSPTGAPSKSPVTDSPTGAPSTSPVTDSPTGAPSKSPVTESPAGAPSKSPMTDGPTGAPSRSPVTNSPTSAPSKSPMTDAPTSSPSKNPVTANPSGSPSNSPVSGSPSSSPSKSPTSSPSKIPTTPPTTTTPTASPSASPSTSPTAPPTTSAPTASPITREPTNSPSAGPSKSPVTPQPTDNPTTLSPTTSPITPAPTARVDSQTPLPTPAPTPPPTAALTPATNGFSVTIPTTTTFTNVNCDDVGQHDLNDIASVAESKACDTMDDNAVESCTVAVGSYDCTSPNDERKLLHRGLRELISTSTLVVEFVATIEAHCSAGCSVSGYAAQAVANQLVATFQNTLRTGIGTGSLIAELRAATSLFGNSNAAIAFGEAVTTILVELVGSWYPDWKFGSGKCLNDGNLPYYMVYNGYTESSLGTCCDRHFSWDTYRCAGVRQMVPSGYFPAWGISSSETKCVASSEETPAYILENPEEWIHSDIESCCKAYYAWAETECIVNSGGIPSTTTGTNQWFIDWAVEKCVKNCEKSSDVQCGGYAEKWDSLYGTASECCERIWYIERSECTI